MNVVYLIVTYEPNQQEFIEHLTINKTAASHIIIVDNSYTAESIQFIKSLEDFDTSIIVNLENLGIAQAQNIGIEFFYEMQYEYLLQLDQDSSLEHNSLCILYNYYQKYKFEYNLAGVAPGDLTSSPEEVREVKSAGLLLEKKVIKKVGLLDTSLFIDLVDYEWCWRAKKIFNYKFHTVPCELNHQLGDNYKVLGLFNLSIPTPIRHYYQVRNSLKLIFTFKAPIIWSIARVFIIFGKLILYPIILPQGKRRLKYMIHGFLNFLLRKNGKFKESMKE